LFVELPWVAFVRPFVLALTPIGAPPSPAATPIVVLCWTTSAPVAPSQSTWAEFLMQERPPRGFVYVILFGVTTSGNPSPFMSM
jgi:hypothetical protein